MGINNEFETMKEDIGQIILDYIARREAVQDLLTLRRRIASRLPNCYVAPTFAAYQKQLAAIDRIIIKIEPKTNDKI